MSVTIRLSRIGKRHAPAYRLIATTTKSKRDGKFLDIIGVYNPSDPKLEFTYDKDKYNQWVKNGAIVSKAVKDIIDGKYVHKSYEPNKKQAEEKVEDTKEETKEEIKEETPVEEPATEEQA